MLGRSALLTLVWLPVLLLSNDRDGTENGASKSSSLAQPILILERFSWVTGVVDLEAATTFLEDDTADDDLLRRMTALTGTSSSENLGLGAAPMSL